MSALCLCACTGASTDEVFEDLGGSSGTDAGVPGSSDSGTDDAAADEASSGGSSGGESSSGAAIDTGGDSSSGEPADPCIGHPCEHDGICEAVDGDAVCACLAGFDGEHCEIDIDECATQPCAHEGTCTDEPGSFVCECADGWQGTTCEDDVDECAQGICLNGSECLNTDGGFACTCAVGFEGVQCEVNVQDCAQGLCQNGGVCIDGIDSYACLCGGNWVGDSCECSLGAATTVDFHDLGEFEAESLYDDPPGMTTTGSGTLAQGVTSSSGLVTGLGLADTYFLPGIPPGEWVQFEFDGPVANVAIYVQGGWDDDDDDVFGEASLDVYDPDDVYLGSMALDVGWHDVSANFGEGQPIGRMVYTATDDGSRLRWVEAGSIDCP
ncbi:MAG: calcium-binding EGF-like domain-containing protein [Myxococcota bacterium]